MSRSPESPQYILSSMTTGGLLEGGQFLPNIPLERIAFLGADLNNPNIQGIHGPLQYDTRSLLDHLINATDLPSRLSRSIYFLTMTDTKEILKQVETLPQRDFYLVLHPDTASGLLLDLIDNKLTLPTNLTLAIENDDNISHSYYLNQLISHQLIPSTASNPSSLECLKALTDLSRQLNLPTHTVLDLEHLAHFDPTITLPQAIHTLDGIDIIHLSGPDHNGLNTQSIKKLVDTVITHNPRPLLKVVLEGPTPPKLLPSQEHTEELYTLYGEITD